MMTIEIKRKKSALNQRPARLFNFVPARLLRGPRAQRAWATHNHPCSRRETDCCSGACPRPIRGAARRVVERQEETQPQSVRAIRPIINRAHCGEPPPRRRSGGRRGWPRKKERTTRTLKGYVYVNVEARQDTTARSRPPQLYPERPFRPPDTRGRSGTPSARGDLIALLQPNCNQNGNPPRGPLP